MDAQVLGGTNSVSAGVYNAAFSAMGVSLYDIDDADHRVAPTSTLALSALNGAHLEVMSRRVGIRARALKDAPRPAALPGVTRTR